MLILNLKQIMKSTNHWIKYSNYGFQIIATLLLFGGVGYYLDTISPKLAPLFLIIGLLIGVAITLYSLWVSIFK